MSWMLVAGKVYHCKKCGECVQVEYESGAELTQVSDVVIDQQSEMLDEFAQPNADPDLEGYYLQEKITCEECYATLSPDNSDAEQLVSLLAEVDAAIKQVVDHVSASLENPTHDDVLELLGKSVFEELSARSMLPARRQRRLTEVFQKWYCLDKFLSNRVKAEIEKLPQPLPSVRLKEFAVQLRKKYLTVYVQKEIWVAENINPYIQSEHTVRVPTLNTPHIRVITEGAIDLVEFKRKGFFINSILEILGDERKNLTNTFKQMAIKHFIGVMP